MKRLPATTRKDFIAACHCEPRKRRGNPEVFLEAWGGWAATALAAHSDEGSYCEGAQSKRLSLFLLDVYMPLDI